MLWLRQVTRGETQRLPVIVTALAIALAGWWVVTTLTAADPATALAGAPGRFNGLWTSLMLLSVFGITATTPISTERANTRITILLASLGLAACYTVAQRIGWDPYVWPFSRPAATIGHPVMLATALGLGAPFALIRALSPSAGTARLIAGAMFLLLTAAMSLTLSRGPMLGLAISLTISLWVVFSPQRISLRTIATASVALGIIVTIATGFVIKSRSGQFFPSADQLLREPEIQNRLHTLSAAAGMARDNRWLGVGLENYHVRYPVYRPAAAERLTPDSVPTMVHSAYLQALVTTGIPGLALYLAFVLSVLAAMVRGYAREPVESRRLLIGGCIAAVCGFLAADVTGWPEVSTSLLLYLLLGLGTSLAAVRAPDAIPSSIARPLRYAAAAAAVAWICVLGFLAVQSVRRIQADAAMRTARGATAVGDWTAMQLALERGLATDGGAAARQDDAGYMFAEAFGRTGRPEFYERGAAALETASRLAPHNEYYRLHRIDLETAALQKRKGGPPAAAVEHGDREPGRTGPAERDHP